MPHTQLALARVRGFTRAFNNHDIEAVLTHVTSDVAASRGDGGRLVGHETLGDFMRRLMTAYPDARLNLREMVSYSEAAVTAEWWFSGTHLGVLDLPWEGMNAPASGRSVEAACAALIYLDASGLISRIESRGDSAALVVAPETTHVDLTETQIRAMAEAYTQAWCSGDPAAVGAFYTEGGWISMNGGAPHTGRAAVSAMAAEYMEAFPRMVFTMDDLQVSGDRAVLAWTLSGDNIGPGGTGKHVAISGFEVWRFDADCLVAESHGYFDTAAYSYQLEHGAPE